MHGQGVASAVPAFLDGLVDLVPAAAGTPPVAGTPTVTLRELASYYKDPATQLLQQHLHLSLDALDDARLPQQEPLAAKFAPLDTVAKKLFFNDGLAAGVWTLQSPPAWLRLGGIMPPGQPGATAWQEELIAVNGLLEQAHSLPGFAQSAPVASNQAIDLNIGGWRVTGQVEKIFVTSVDDLVQWQLLRPFPARKGELKKESALSFKDRVPLFLDWALLRLHTAHALGTDAPPIRLRALVADKEPRWQDGINAWDTRFMTSSPDARATLLGDLERRVGQLLQWWHEAQTTPRWYFPKAAWETLSAELCPKSRKSPAAGATTTPPESPPVTVGQAWVSDHDGGGERSYAPGYSQLLAGDVDFANGSSQLAALHAFAQQLHACISFDAALTAVTP